MRLDEIHFMYKYKSKQWKMKKFVLSYEYIQDYTKYSSGLTTHRVTPRTPLAVSGDISPLIKSVENHAQRIFQVKNPNFLKWKKWDINNSVTKAEVIVTYPTDEYVDAIHFVINEVDYII